MNILVASFYADIHGKPSRLDEFLPLILASKRALAITNPSAKYIILTDNNTAKPLITQYGIDVSVVVPDNMPLMLKVVFAQRLLVLTSFADLIILPDVDCLANQNLEEAIPKNVGLAITHRGKKFEYKINNLAYIRDKELAVWFFDRAYDILKNWPRGKQEWEGDHEAWQAALAPPLAATSWYDFEDLGDDILVSRPDGRDIYLYPCRTHNCFMNDGGVFQRTHENAYMVHLKGPRKQHLDKWMKYRFGSSNESSPA